MNADGVPPEEEKTGDPPGTQWPESLGFWVAVTFGTIAATVIICAGGLRLVRALYPG